MSVVMPVYDAARTLAAALDSVRGQTEPAWELIAVDDGSRDGSGAMLDDVARQDARIRVIHTPHRGIVAALEAAVDIARGRFIARMDADDLSMPARLECQRRHLDDHPDVGLVACRVRFAGDPGRAAGYARYVAWTNGLLTHEQIAAARFVESPLAHPSVMFRRELVARLGGYADGDFPEDYELWLRWLDAGVRMEKLAETLVAWTDDPGRLSRRDPRYGGEAFDRVKARYLARWIERQEPRRRDVIVWGAGRTSRRRARHFVDAGIEITAYIDIDPRKIGRVIDGRRVLKAEALPPVGDTFVVACVGSVGAREQIEARLRGAGYRAGVDYVLAA
ncbi:MAG TPA: glycosyltransferase [Terriglobales bacterium]|nr:glycosyltransferase [Terriglobales bacterium]